MTKENGVKVLTDMVADFVAHIGKKLPDDVVEKLEELGSQESAALPKVLYETMTKNQGLAVELNRPSCQDTGVLQFWLKCGTNFPYINELEALLKEAVVQATFAAPLRHNSVETFDEYNTKKNVGKGTPTVWWDIVPNSDKCEIYAYMAGGGCTLPGKAMVLMPGAGYEGVTDFVLDQMTSYGLNACPPLLVGVGVGTSVETAALNSKKALMRPVDSENEDPYYADLEKEMLEKINQLGIGAQGFGGKTTAIGLNIETMPTHIAGMPCAINISCHVTRHKTEATAMGQDVFISYKSEEFQEADWVRQQLESGGISCWMAPNSITGGASYATEIPQAIRSCRAVL